MIKITSKAGNRYLTYEYLNIDTVERSKVVRVFSVPSYGQPYSKGAPGNPYRKGSISTVDLLSCFVKKKFQFEK